MASGLFSSSSMVALERSKGCAPRSGCAVDEEVGRAARAELGGARPCRRSICSLLLRCPSASLELVHVEADLLARTSRGSRDRASAGSRTACRASPRTFPARAPPRPRAPPAWRSGGRAAGCASRRRVRRSPKLLDTCRARHRRALQKGHWKSENSTMVTGGGLPPRRRVADGNLTDLVASAGLRRPLGASAAHLASFMSAA